MLMPASTFSTASSAASGVPPYQLPLMYTMAEYEDGTNWTPSTTTTPSSSTPEHEHYLRSYYLGSALDVDGSSSDNGSAGLGLAAANAAAAAAATANVPQQRDTTWTKLFVGGLPYHTTDKSLRDHFKIYGEIEEAVVITDRQTGKSRGYGFVIMSDRASAERACKEPNPIIDGRKANVNLAILGAKPRGNVSSAAAFPFTAIRTGYPTSILASQYGLPASYVYQPTAYGGAPLLSLPATTASPALAAAIANAQGNPGMSQFYDYQPQQLTASGVNQGQANQAAAAAAFAASPSAAAHFAAQAAFASDPYASSAYFAATAGGAAPHAAAAAAAHQQHAAHAAYAAYLPQMGGMPGGGGPGIATSQGIQINPYAAAITQDARIQ